MIDLRKETVSKKEYGEFRDLLKSCIGSESQSDFAIRANISKEHLNRLLKNDLISRPSKDTIKKIYTASNNKNVSIDALMLSCDYTSSDSAVVKRTLYSSLTEDENRDAVANSICKSFATIVANHKIYSNIESIFVDYKNNFMDTPCQIRIYTDKAENVPAILSVDDCLPDFSVNFGKGEQMIAANIVWRYRVSSHDVVINSLEFLLTFVTTNKGGILLTNAIFKPSLVLSGHPDRNFASMWIDTITSTDDIVDLDDIGYVIICKRETDDHKETPEEKLLKSIFGSPDDECIYLRETKYGYGFSYTSVPNNLIYFIRNHKEAFCHESEIATEIYEELFDENDNLYSQISNDKLEEYLLRLPFCKNSGEVVASIIRYELTRDFSEAFKDIFEGTLLTNIDYFAVADEYKDTLSSVVMIDDELLHSLQDRATRDSIRVAFDKYAKELGQKGGDVLICVPYEFDKKELSEYINNVQK